MAQRFPSSLPFDPSALEIGFQREWAVVESLIQGLPESWRVFHGIPWIAPFHQRMQPGEWDVVVLSPSGHVLILEVKSGAVSVGAKELSKRYGSKTKSVTHQLNLQRHALLNKLRRAGLPVLVDQALVLTDAYLASETANVVPARVVDASRLPYLVEEVESWLKAAPEHPELVEQVTALLLDELHLLPDPRVMADRLREATIALQSGLAQTFAQVRLPAGGVLAIDAAAGSGKTLLASHWLRQSKARGERWAYLCFNRPLADAMQAAHPEAMVMNLHDLAFRLWRKLNPTQSVDFTNPQSYEQILSALAEDSSWGQRLDGVILDEAMDWKLEWYAAFTQGLGAHTRQVILLDEDQAAHPHMLNEQSAWWRQLPQAITLSVQENFRTPRAIVKVINQLGLTSRTLIPRSLFEGHVPAFVTYPDGDQAAMLEGCAAQVKHWLEEGVPPQDMAVLTFSSLKSSALLKEENLAGLTLRRPDGYEQGRPKRTDGVLLADTVLRFKGQSVPCVLITEVDWETLDAASLRKLYIALSRAEWQAAVVLSERASRDLTSRLI
jgi:hypothetical protein